MDLDIKQRHAQQIDAWIEQVGNGLSSKKLAQLFGQAIDVLWQRSQFTLNEITLAAIFDRALSNSQEKFPLLATLTVDSNGVCWNDFMTNVNDFTPNELTKAFRYFLAEVMAIIGNLTDEILITPIYSELRKITPNDVLHFTNQRQHLSKSNRKD